MLNFMALMTNKVTEGPLVNALKMKGTVILEFIKGSNDRTCMI
jgi:hypothetical protein